jgi:hypothetical protein
LQIKNEVLGEIILKDLWTGVLQVIHMEYKADLTKRSTGLATISDPNPKPFPTPNHATPRPYDTK